MKLHPIYISEDQTQTIYSNPTCQELFKIYTDYYQKIGFNPPWIGYFIVRDNQIVGTCSFTGQPLDQKIEIAYYTFKEFEGQGIASFACRELISISKTADPQVIITAKTAPQHNHSTKILERNGFEFSGIVKDEEIGEAWEWVYKKVD
jgi:[ribosomal protein S5]-alanine N-acetyltransferase